jgi:hypothetical protein
MPDDRDGNRQRQRLAELALCRNPDDPAMGLLSSARGGAVSAFEHPLSPP